ncbi:MAG: hypothetical protein ACR2JB_02515 [Bryobacteraceae bacterium]
MIPVAIQQYMLLERNLLYTGVTGGKTLVLLVGEQKALRMQSERTIRIAAIPGYVVA